jgi:hypothetical protein
VDHQKYSSDSNRLEGPGFEDMIRALFAGDAAKFGALIAVWPEDIAAHLRVLAGEAFDVSKTLSHGEREGPIA